MATIIIERVSKIYEGGVTALSEVNLKIDDGELVVVVGPSGCGKSTLLRVIAGLEELTSGNIYIGGKKVNDLAPKNRDVAMVFQDYALYPHMTVRRNLAYSLKLRRMPKADIKARVSSTAEMLGLSSLLDRKPGKLSGGQKQRVALGRAIIREPLAFLMDEPLSNLDAKLRAQMRAEISRLHDRLGATTLYVTHDQAEAMTLADRVVALKDGEVQQVAPPDVMYEEPANLFVAGFVGSPAMNFFNARLEVDGRTYVLIWRGNRFEISGTQVDKSPDLRRCIGKEMIVGIRPEHIKEADSATDAPDSNAFLAEVRVAENLGSQKFIYFERPSQSAPGETGFKPIIDSDDSLWGNLMVARISSERKVRRGEKIALVLDANRLRLFDPESEEAIL